MFGTYTVNQNGTASDSVFLSFSSLVDSIQSKGVSGKLVINVIPNSGPYRDKIQLNNIQGLTVSDSIVFNGNGNEIITVVDSNNRNCLYAGNIPNLIISDFTFTLVDSLRFGFWRDIVGVHGNSETFEIINCQLKFESINATPFFYGNFKRYINLSANGIDGSVINSNIKNLKIESVSAKGGAFMGCFKYYSSITNDTSQKQWVFRNNIIKDVFYGVYWVGAVADEIIIQNNVIENSDSSRFWNNNFFYAFLINDLQGNVAQPIQNRTFIIEKNLIRNDYGISQSNQNCIGIRLNSRFRERVEIANNILELTGRTNSFIEFNNYQLSSRGSKSIIAHNTLLLDKNAMSTTPMTATFIKGANIYASVYEELNIKNNLIFSNAKRLGSLSGIDVGSSNFGDSLTFISNNLLYTEIDSFNTYFSGNNCSVTVPSDYANCSIFDTTNLIGINPIFLSLQNLMYVPTNLLAYKKGTPIGSIRTDYFDQERSTTSPQIGAIESLSGLKVTDIFNDLDSFSCNNHEGVFSFVVENNSGIDIENLVVELAVNNEVRIVESFRKALKNGQSDTFEFSVKLVLHGSGQQKIDIYIAGTNLDSTHLYKSVTITLKSMPSGLSLLPKLNTNKYFFDGDSLRPDIVLVTDELKYDLEIPSNYSWSNMGVDWDFINVSYSENYTSIDSLEGLKYDIQDGLIAFSPSNSMMGELVTLRFLFEDLQTGCDTILERKIRVLETPKPDFDFSFNCFGDTTVLTNNTYYDGIDNLQAIWDFNENGITSNSWDSKHNFTNKGLKNVELMVRFERFPNYVFHSNKTIVVVERPQPNFEINNDCVHDSIRFNDLTSLDILSSANADYFWDFGIDSSTSNAIEPVFKFKNSGQYDVLLRINIQGCVGMFTKEITINPSPIVDFEMNSLCLLDTLFVNNKTTIEKGDISYFWNFNGTGTSSDKNPNFLFNDEGTKVIKLTAQSDLGCIDSLIKELKLGRRPSLELDNNIACLNIPTRFQMVNLDKSIEVSEWQWKINDTVVSNSDSLIHIFNNEEKIMFEINAKTNMDCEVIHFDTIYVLDNPTANFEVSDICQGEDAVFNNTSVVSNDFATYSWFFGDGNTSDQKSPVYNYGDLFGVVSVTLEVGYTNGCDDQIVKQVSIEKAPSAEFEFIKFESLNVTVRAIEDNLIYRWRMGDGSRYETREVNHIYWQQPHDTAKICLLTRNDANCWSLEYCKNITEPFGSTELAQKQALNIKLYPNPNKGIFNVSLSDVSNNLELEVFDVLGNKIPFAIASIDFGLYSLDLGNVAAGVYLVKIQNDSRYEIVKLMVNK